MPYIKVSPNAMSSISETLRNSSSKVGRVESDFSSVAGRLDWDVRSASDIQRRIDRIKSELDDQSRMLSNMYAFVLGAKRQYDAVNTKTSAKSSSPIKVGRGGNTHASIQTALGDTTEAKSSGVETVNRNFGIAGKANDVLKKMGYFGNVVGFFTKPIVSWIDSGTFQISETGAKAVVSILKESSSTLKGLYDWKKSDSGLDKLARMLPERAREVRIKRLFGLNDMFAGKASQAGSWSTRFYNNFHKLKGPLDSYTSGGAKAAFAWVGLGLTAISNTISNIDEYKTGKIGVPRAVAETITETVVDVGKSWLIGAGVAAGLAATVGSAPVLAVGAITVGVTFGLDWATKKITGALTGEEKGLTEAISDFALDVGKGAISLGKKAVTSVVKNAKDGWSSLTGLFSNGFRPLFCT